MESKLKDYLEYLAVEKGYSPNTIKAYDHDLDKFFTFLRGKALKKVTRRDVFNFLKFLAQKGFTKKNDKPTRARRLSSVHSFFKYLVKEDYIKINPAEGIDAPKLDSKEPSFLTEDECGVLLQAVEINATSYYRLRDTAIIKLFLTAGLRLSELVGLNITDVNFKESLLKVFRKGRKEQLLPLNKGAAEALRLYLEKRNDKEPALFISRLSQRIGKGAVACLVKKYAKKAGINKKKVSPHTLRHSFCTMLFNKGVNIAVIQQLAGHRSLETVRRYLHLVSDDLKDAVKLI